MFLRTWQKFFHIFFSFETGSYYVAQPSLDVDQTSLKLVAVLLPLSLGCCDYKSLYLTKSI